MDVISVMFSCFLYYVPIVYCSTFISRISQLSVTDDNQSRVSAVVKEKDVIIGNLQNT